MGDDVYSGDVSIADELAFTALVRRLPRLEREMVLRIARRSLSDSAFDCIAATAGDPIDMRAAANAGDDDERIVAHAAQLDEAFTRGYRRGLEEAKAA